MTRHRVVILCDGGVMHRNTCATIIRSGANVVALCVSGQRTRRARLAYVWRRVRRKGATYVASQVAARLLHDVVHAGHDARMLGSLVDVAANEATIRDWPGEVIRVGDFSSPDVEARIAALDPDVLVVHSGAIIPAGILRLPRTRLTIGGHPGLTPRYRGSHSAFWALAAGRPHDVGCTVFLLDEGIDTGGIVAQARIPVTPDDSFMTLGWKGMAIEAEIQARLIAQLDAGLPPAAAAEPVPPGSYFDNPCLSDYLRYRREAPCR
ncbi:MAG: formyl transferase [Vicinamibacterales bacterium]